jgi:hypothetical protein
VLLVGRGGGESVNPLAGALIDSVDWSSYLVLGGPATAIGPALRDLLSSSDVSESSVAWKQIEEQVFSQGTIYSAAEPTVSVMVAALTEEQPSWRNGRIVDLLFFIVRGASETDPTLQDRCRDRAREGLWLLARWALTHQGWERDNVLEVIEVIAPERAEMIRAALPAG